MRKKNAVFWYVHMFRGPCYPLLMCTSKRLCQVYAHMHICDFFKSGCLAAICTHASLLTVKSGYEGSFLHVM